MQPMPRPAQRGERANVNRSMPKLGWLKSSRSRRSDPGCRVGAQSMHLSRSVVHSAAQPQVGPRLGAS